LKFIQRFGAILLIIAAAFFVYAPALRNGFVWDDTALVLRDPLIRSWRLIPEGFRQFLFLDATGANFYRPMQRVSFTLDYALWGFGWPGGWHLTSIAVHALAAIFLYLLLRRWWGEGRAWWAAGVALLWVIHPLHTSAVTYVAGRADPLAAMFGFAGLLLLWISLEEGRVKTGLWRLGAAGCFFGAVLSKESGIIFMVLALALLIWRRVSRGEWLRWAVLLPVILGGYLLLRLTAAQTPPPASKSRPVADRPVIAARAIAEYAGLIVAPVSLRMERDVASKQIEGAQAGRVSQGSNGQTLVGMILIVGLIAVFLWCRRSLPEAAVMIVAAGIAYFPISNVTSLNATVAEHWLYVPSAFLFAAGGLILRRWNSRIALAVVGLWAVALGVRTFVRQGDWYDGQTFLLRTIEAGGDSARMRVNLGNIAAAAGNIDQAMAEYQAALERRPNLAFALLAIAGLEMKRGHFAEARKALDLAEQQPGFASEVRVVRGALDFTEKKIDPTPVYREAAELSPLNWPLRKRYLNALVLTGHLPVAIEELRAFLMAQDFRAETWQYFAELLTQAGRPDLAAVAHEEARLRDVRLP